MNEFSWLHGWHYRYTTSLSSFIQCFAWHSRYLKSETVRRIPLDTIGSWCIKNAKNRCSISTVAFYLSHARDKTKNTSFSILYRAQNLQSLISYSKYNLKLTIFLIWIWRSDVRFLTGTQNFFFAPRSWQDEKNQDHVYCRHSRPIHRPIYQSIYRSTVDGLSVDFRSILGRYIYIYIYIYI